MKANSYIKSTNIFNLIQIHFDSINLSKIGIHWSIFTHTPHPPVVAEIKPDAAAVSLRDWGNTSNRQLQKPQLARRHHSLNWRWQSQLMQWF